VTDRIEAPAYLASATEAQWQAFVVDAARRVYGWHVIHVRNMLANDPGIPDLLMFRADRYLLIELKSERGRVSARQERWHEDAGASAVPVHVFRPSQWPELEEMLR
jgi:hypothetical protein